MENKKPSWLWHPEKPAQIYSLTDAEYHQMLEDGYSDTPLEGPVEPGSPADNTPAELSAEVETMLAKFVSAPTELTKDQLIELGKSFGIEKLTRNMSEATLIKRIQDYLDGNSK